MIDPTPAKDLNRARARSTAALMATRTLKAQIDATLDMWRGRLVQLRADLLAASKAVGGDSTRPSYTDDLQHFNRQRRRLEILQDALNNPEL